MAHIQPSYMLNNMRLIPAQTKKEVVLPASNGKGMDKNASVAGNDYLECCKLVIAVAQRTDSMQFTNRRHPHLEVASGQRLASPSGIAQGELGRQWR